jgi:hypothetical protein
MRFNRNDDPSNATLPHYNPNDAVVETALGNISECLTQSFAEEPAHQVGCTLRAKKKSMPPWAAYTIDGFCFAYRLFKGATVCLVW